MTDSAADRLTIAAAQLDATQEMLYDRTTAADLPAIAAYLAELVEHGHNVASAARALIDGADSAHPLRAIPIGIDVQAALGHVAALCDAAMAFAGSASDGLR